MTLFPLHAKTLSGLEQVLAAELTEFGATDVTPGHRLVTFVGDQRLMYLANLGCRTAIRILKPIANFPADSERALYDGVQQIDWSRFLDPDRSLAIDPVVWSSFCTHSLFVAQLSKDAIVDQFRERTGRRPSVDRSEPDLRINIHLVENVATVYLDSSGDSLHRRGYRAMTGDAPLGEVLAAGILRLTEWDRESALLDPMCGSGTFCIEAALLARNMAPGVIRRRFGFQTWKDYDPSLRDTVLAELRRGELPSLPFPIVGSDIDAEVVSMARENARRAGVGADVRFETANAECCQPPAPTGTLVMNPPYDERLKVDQIASFYRRIGDTFKQRFAGYTAWVFTGNLDAAKQIGLRPSRKVRLFNGPIECRLLRFDMYSGTRRTPPDLATPESAEGVAAAAQDTAVESSLGATAAEMPRLPAQVQVEPFSVPPAGATKPRCFAIGSTAWESTGENGPGGRELPASGFTIATFRTCRWSSTGMRGNFTSPNSCGHTIVPKPSIASGWTSSYERPRRRWESIQTARPFSSVASGSGGSRNTSVRTTPATCWKSTREATSSW